MPITLKATYKMNSSMVRYKCRVKYRHELTASITTHQCQFSNTLRATRKVANTLDQVTIESGKGNAAGVNRRRKYALTADRATMPSRADQWRLAGQWHTVGDQQLHLVGAPPSGPGIDPTGHHYCVAVDDLDAAIAELEARGIDYKRAVQGESTVQIWITDPAGNTVELQQERGR